MYPFVEFHNRDDLQYDLLSGRFSTYLAGGGIHLQLRGLIPFPLIVTHRRLANLDSFVNNHTAGLFGVDLSCSRWTELLGLGRSPRSHRSSTSGAQFSWRSSSSLVGSRTRWTDWRYLPLSH